MLYSEISQFLESLDINDISEYRKSKLMLIKEYISTEKESDINLMFICTHNSRRSQFAQVWATVCAYYYEHKHIHAYSGGTEVTELNKNVIDSLMRTGFHIKNLGRDKNKIYFSPNTPALLAYSKLYHQLADHLDRFIAIMTCDHADQNCPFIPNAIKRFSLPYPDPKVYDSDSRVHDYYDTSSHLIAKEMKFLFSR